MKYLTKEWYRKSQTEQLTKDLHPHAKAAEIDENLFQKLYAEKEADYVRSAQDEFEGLLEFIDIARLFLEDEIERILQGDEVSQEDKDKIQSLMDSDEDFDPETAKKEFQAEYEERLISAPEKLPPEILSQIADLRLYALGFVSKELYNRLKKTEDEDRVFVREYREKADRTYKEQGIAPAFARNFRFRGKKFINIREEKEDLILDFPKSKQGKRKNCLKFINAQEIERDEELIGKNG